MVNRQDIRDLNGEIQEFIEAVDELEELADTQEKSGVTVDSTAYADAQERVKACVAELYYLTDEMVDRTDVLEDDEGNTRVSLPNAALDRSSDSTSPPKKPDSANN